MTDLSAWARDARAAGASTRLEIARHVWHHHHAEIEGSDLVLTWQLDLVAAETSPAPPARRRWTEPELALAAGAYVTLLRAEHTGAPARRSEVLAPVVATGHPAAAVEALMANISAVVAEHDLEPLASYPPRSNVPVGVRDAVAAALAD